MVRVKQDGRGQAGTAGRVKRPLQNGGATPGDGGDGADEEEPAGGAGEGNGGDNDEGPVEMAGALKDESCDGGNNDSGEITNEVLKTSPAAGGDGAGESLGDGPEIGREHAEEDDPEDERGGAVDRMVDAGETDEESAQASTAARKGFAHESERSARGNPTIGEPSGNKRSERAEKVCRADEPGHACDGEIAFADEIVRQPCDEEIADVVGGEEAEAGAPGGAKLEEFEEGRSARDIGGD